MGSSTCAVEAVREENVVQDPLDQEIRDTRELMQR